MEDHFLLHGIVKNYTRWIHHEENYEYDSIFNVGDGDGDDDEGDGFDDDIIEMFQDIVNASFMGNLNYGPTKKGPFGEVNMFYEMLNDLK